MFPLPIHVLSRATDWENPLVHQFSLSMRENLYMYRIFDAQHVYKFLRNLETRMYRAFGTQHGYDVFKKNVCIDFKLF